MKPNNMVGFLNHVSGDITKSVVSLNLVTVPGWEGARPDPMIKTC